MLRCVLLAAACAVAAQGAAAQAPIRNFPGNAMHGDIVVQQPPELLLNQRPARLAPGARIRGTDNMLLLSGALVDQRVVVNYTLDLTGSVLDVWVLTPAEIARRPWPATPEQAATWTFNPATQTWTRP